MNAAEYRRTTERELKGQRFVLRHKIERRDGSIIAVGTIVEIRAKFAGFEIRTDRCEHCGVQLGCTRIPPEYLGERVS